jgi:amino acid transporter
MKKGTTLLPLMFVLGILWGMVLLHMFQIEETSKVGMFFAGIATAAYIILIGIGGRLKWRFKERWDD